MSDTNKYVFYGLLIITLIVTLYIVYKRYDELSPSPSPSGGTPTSGGGGPVINVQGIKRTLNPDNSDNGTSTSGYAIREYSTGNYDYNELSKNVNVSIVWDNKGGFESIHEIIAKWSVKPNENSSYEVKMTKTVSRDDQIAAYTSYSINNKVTFTGDGNFSAIGDNIVDLYYKLGPNTEEVKLTPDIGDGFEAWNIQTSDLSATLDSTTPLSYTYKPGTFEGESAIIVDYGVDYYYLFSDALHRDVIDQIYNVTGRNKVDNYVRLIPSGSSKNIVRFRNQALYNTDKAVKHLKINTTTHELELDSTELGTDATGNHEFIIYKSKSDDTFLIGLDNSDYEGWYLYYDKTDLKYKMGDFPNPTKSNQKTKCEFDSIFFKLVEPTELSIHTVSMSDEERKTLRWKDCEDTAWDAEKGYYFNKGKDICEYVYFSAKNDKGKTLYVSWKEVTGTFFGTQVNLGVQQSYAENISDATKFHVIEVEGGYRIEARDVPDVNGKVYYMQNPEKPFASNNLPKPTPNLPDPIKEDDLVGKNLMGVYTDFKILCKDGETEVNFVKI
jgi:hypothetical protein